MSKVQKRFDEAAYNKLAALYRIRTESHHAGERENARNEFAKAARDFGFSVEALEGLIRDYLLVRGQASDQSTPSGSPSPMPSLAETIAALRGMILWYAILPEHADLVLALWAAGSYVHRRFMHSPRLVLDSAEPGCGKTTILDILANVCNNGERCDDLTAASVYQHLDATAGNATLLLDEADNYDFRKDRRLLRMYNSGHRRGGFVWRGSMQGRRRKFPIFAPMAAAGIDASATFTSSMLERAIVIPLLPATAAESRRLRQLDLEDPDIVEQLAAVRLALSAWAREVELDNVKLNTSPEMPSELHNRAADNWRSLIAVADSASAELGALALKAAAGMSRGQRRISPGILLLFDIRAAFDEHRVDRFSSADLVKHLLANAGDKYHGEYQEWRGKTGDGPPRRLNPTLLAAALERYKVYPHSVRFGPGPLDTARGYRREWFEKAWQVWDAHWKAFHDGRSDQNDPDDQPARNALRVLQGFRRG